MKKICQWNYYRILINSHVPFVYYTTIAKYIFPSITIYIYYTLVLLQIDYVTFLLC